MKVLLVGSGGREHSLAWKLAQSHKCTELYCAPGNPGISECAEIVDIADTDIEGLVDFAKDKAIDLVVVGPESPLVAGISDSMRAQGIRVFGPSEAASQMEGSKAFMKRIVSKYNLPTAAYAEFTDLAAAKAFIKKQSLPVVLKTDGLAAGKGVIIAQTIEEAIRTAEEMLSGQAFGAAGRKIVIEEFLDGEELSFFAITDGKTVLPLTSAQDHKRAFDGDKGPNTGGMGAYSPAHMMTSTLFAKITNDIIKPTVDAMAQEGCPFTGVLFAGIMLVRGEPKLLEYNIRFGDPECQVMMMRLRTDLLALLDAAADGRLAEFEGKLEWNHGTALCVVMAANGYPGSYEKGSVIQNLDEANTQEGVKIFHAGTRKSAKGEILASGGRVLGVAATGNSVAQARENAYRAVDLVNWPGGFCRRDIGWRAAEPDADVRKVL